MSYLWQSVRHFRRTAYNVLVLSFKKPKVPNVKTDKLLHLDAPRPELATRSVQIVDRDHDHVILATFHEFARLGRILQQI